MTLDFFRASAVGVSKITLSDDEGVPTPFLQQVQAVNHDRVRFVFSRAMRSDIFIGGTLVNLLDPANYIIKEAVTLHQLNIVRVYRRNDSEVEAICDNMANVQYTASVSPNIEDVHGAKIGTSGNSRLFTGLTLVYPEINDLYGFFGLYSGIQLQTLEGVAPDSEGPSVNNETPSSGELVHPVTRVSFDLTDDSGVNQDSVVIRIEDRVAWQNDTQQTGFKVKKTEITDGYHYDVDIIGQYTHESAIPVRIQASDLWPGEPNTSDTQWSFNTGSRGPYAEYQFPAPNADESSESLIIVELVAELEIRKETIRIWIKPGDDEVFEFAFDYDASPRFKPMYNGTRSKMEPINNGLRITLDRIEKYNVGEVVTVLIHSAEKI
jgi:hypothetical protein